MHVPHFLDALCERRIFMLRRMKMIPMNFIEYQIK